MKLMVLREHLRGEFGVLLFQVLFPLQILVVLLPLFRLNSLYMRMFSFKTDERTIGFFDDLLEFLLAEAILEDLAGHRRAQLLLRLLHFDNLLGYLLVFEMLRNVMMVCGPLQGRVRARVMLR